MDGRVSVFVLMNALLIKSMIVSLIAAEHLFLPGIQLAHVSKVYASLRF